MTKQEEDRIMAESVKREDLTSDQTKRRWSEWKKCNKNERREFVLAFIQGR